LAHKLSFKSDVIRARRLRREFKGNLEIEVIFLFGPAFKRPGHGHRPQVDAGGEGPG
jgi:hypothetical protein